MAGSVVLTVGLLIARVPPWWVTGLVGTSIFAIFFASADPTGLVTTLVMITASVLAARRPLVPAPHRASGSASPIAPVDLAR